MTRLTARVSVSIFFFLYFLTALVRSDSTINIAVVGKYAGGYPRAVAVRGKYAYVAAMGILSIIDIADPDNPVQVSFCDTPGTAEGVHISGDYAYVSSGPAGLVIVDISDPLTPVVGSCDTPGFAYSAYVSGDYAYVADKTGGLQIIHVSIPSNPFKVGSYSTSDDARGVFVSSSYAYVAVGNAGLEIVNVSSPSAPSKAGIIDTDGHAMNVVISSTYAYVANGASGLQVINIADPTNPVKDGVYADSGVSDVCVVGKYAYLSGAKGLVVLDISVSSAPFRTGYCSTPGFAFGVYATAGYAYIADGSTGLRIFDVTDPALPEIKGSYDTPGLPEEVYVAGNYAYVAGSYSSGLSVIDISIPADPLEKGFCSTPGPCLGVHVSGNYAYVAASGSGLISVDITNPALPVVAGKVDIPSYARDVYVSDTYAYVVAGSSGLRIIDISDSSDLKETGFYDTLGKAYGIFVSFPFAYVAAGETGLRIINISSPTAPFETGFYDTLGFAEGVYVSGSHAFVADNQCGLRIIDISDPENPAEIGFYYTPGSPKDVVVSGNYAYVADGYSGVRMIDISDPVNPVEKGFFDTPGNARGIFVSGVRVYVADYGSGLWILEPEIPFISSVTPSSGKNGDTLIVSIAGENFSDGCSLSFSGSGITISSVTWHNQNLIKSEIIISTDAVTTPSSSEFRDVSITNPDGLSWTAFNGFTINYYIDTSSPTGSLGDCAIARNGFLKDIKIEWKIGTSTDSGSDIAGFYLVVLDSSTKKQYFAENVGNVFQKTMTIINENVLNERDPIIYAEVSAVNGFGLISTTTAVSPLYDTYDSTAPTGVPKKPVISQQNVGAREVRVEWEIGTSLDPESDIMGYYLYLGTDIEPEKYFRGFVSATTKIVELPELATLFATVRAVNGSGLLGDESPKSDAYQVLDLTPPIGKPARPVIFQENVNNGTIRVSWKIGDCDDPETGIAGFYLEVGTRDDIDAYFKGPVGYVFQKTLQLPLRSDVAARVQAINGAGLFGEFSDISTVFTILAVPSITSISPSWVNKRTTYDVTVRGGQFSADTLVSFSNAGILVSSVTFVDVNTLTASITVPYNVPAGTYDVIVSESGGSSMLSGGFEVREGFAANAGQVKIQGGVKGYVNPSRGETAKIHFRADGPGVLKVTTYTLKGFVVWEGSKDTDGSEDVLVWDCRNNDGKVISSGIYVVYVDGPGIHAIKKVAVIK